MRLIRPGILNRLFLLPILFATAVLAQNNEPFPGFAWGTPFQQVHAVRPLSTPESDECEERYPVTVDRLGGADIALCEFEFTDGLFSGIVLMTRGQANTDALRRYLERRFGKGDLTDVRFWQWMNEETYVSLDEDSAGDGYVLWYGIRWQGERNGRK